MSKQTKKAVQAATSTVITDWNVETIVTQWVSAAESVRDIFARIVAHYGEAVVCKAAAGGFNARSVKDKTEEQYKAEASRLSIAPSAVRELHMLQIAIKEKVGLHAWQNAQDTYFGKDEPKAAAPKDEPENIKALRTEKAEHEKNAIQCKAAAALAKAAMLTAESDSDYESAKARMDDANKAAKAYTEAAKACAADIKAAAESNAGADAYGALCDALRKLGEKYAAHKDAETAELAKQVLALL